MVTLEIGLEWLLPLDSRQRNKMLRISWKKSQD